VRAVIQRVNSASVSVEGEVISSIGKGLLVLVGFHKDDKISDSGYIINKILGLRIFEDANGLMNLSVSDIGGEILVVSQFTLYGDARAGKRPSFSTSMPSNEAALFYDNFINKFKESFNSLKCGVFGANMEVSLINSGPVTIILDSSKNF
jgi:D-tyrosyl-tRNA(Tyr) deacylase